MSSNEFRRLAKDQVVREIPQQTRCRVIEYLPAGSVAGKDTGPTAFVVPYSDQRQTAASYADFDAFSSQYVKEVRVLFPEGIKFHVDPEKYDILVEGSFAYANSGIPVRKLGNGSVSVPEGAKLTALTAENDSIKQRIMNLKGALNASRSAEASYPAPGETWHGPVRHSLDRQYVEFWSSPARAVQKLSHQASSTLTGRITYPMTRGINVVWQDKIENPLQEHIGSSNVIEYRRFIYSFVDPGYVVVVVRSLIDLFRAMDEEANPGFTFKSTYDVFDFRDKLPED